MNKLLVIANPASGKGRAARALSAFTTSLTSNGLAHHVMLTDGPGHAARLAQQMAQDFDAVAVVGGDGTLNEVASSIAGTGVPMAPVPGGTGNDFIKALSTYPRTPQGVALMLSRETSIRELDMALANGRPFINVLGMGFDAMVAEHQAHARMLPGLAAYLYGLARSMPSYRHWQVTISADDQELRTRALIVTIGNGPVCGGGFKLTPDAVADDGQLDITVLSDLPLSRLIWHFPKAFTGGIKRVMYYASCRARKIVLESDSPIPCHMDGEPLAPQRRFEIELLPRALRVLEPATKGRALIEGGLARL